MQLYLNTVHVFIKLNRVRTQKHFYLVDKKNIYFNFKVIKNNEKL